MGRKRKLSVHDEPTDLERPLDDLLAKILQAPKDYHGLHIQEHWQFSTETVVLLDSKEYVLTLTVKEKPSQERLAVR